MPASSSRGCSGPTLLSSERGMAQSSSQSLSSWVFTHSHRVCMPGGVKTVGGEREGGTYEGRTGMRKIVRGDSHMGSLSHRTLLSHRGLSSSRVSGGWNRAPFDGRASSLSGRGVAQRERQTTRDNLNWLVWLPCSLPCPRCLALTPSLAPLVLAMARMHTSRCAEPFGAFQVISNALECRLIVLTPLGL